MISKIILSISKLTNDYIDVTVNEPYEALKSKYKNNTKLKANKFSISDYIKKQKQMTSPELRNSVYVNNCELRKTYIRDFKSNNDVVH